MVVRKIEWENMVEFAAELITRSYKLKKGSKIEQRIAILHLDHATELLMKAYLKKEGYFINYFNIAKIKIGIKKNAQLQDFLHNDKTIGFEDALGIIIKKISLSAECKKIFKEFHKLRNEIQHRALCIPLDKTEKIDHFAPCLIKFYSQLFPQWPWSEMENSDKIIKV